VQSQRFFAAKARTCIVGVEVDENARGTLIAECGAILNDVSSMPADAEFRKQTETLFGYIKKACEDPAIKDDAELEVKVSLGNGVGTAPPPSRALLPGTPPSRPHASPLPPFPQLDRGQLEEIIVTARNHRSLIPKMLAAKPWANADTLEVKFWEADESA